jgi:hypothetical protein
MKLRLILWAMLVGLIFCQSALAALVPPDPSWASTEIECDEIPITPTDWSDSVTIPLFDPAIGDLQQADVTVKNSINQNAGFENLAITEDKFTTETGADVTTTLLDGTTQIVSTVGTGEDSYTLPPFDGNKDFLPPSGFSYNLVDSATEGYSVIDATALAAYIGAGETREFPTEATGFTTMKGAGNIAAEVTTSAGAEVCVKYYYIPKLDISGKKVNDCTDEGLADWTITLTKPGGATVSTQTSTDGTYSFTGLVPGEYQVCETPQTGWTPIGVTCMPVTLTADISLGDFRNKPDITITCPPDVTIECTDSLDPAVNPNLGTATATVTGGTARVTYTDSSEGTCPTIVTRTWTATYGDCTESCTQTIAVDDTIAPVLPELPTGDDLGCNPAVLPSCTVDLMATDNCDGNVPVSCVPGEITGEGCDKEQVFTYSATDTCGNTASGTVTYTWKEDEIAPVLSGYPTENPTVSCYADVPAAATVTALDGCDGAIDVAFEETESNPGSSCGNVITRTWTATDECGNEVSYTQTITVDDTTAPVNVVPEGGNLGCNPETLPTIESVTSGVSATDNCDR